MDETKLLPFPKTVLYFGTIFKVSCPVPSDQKKIETLADEQLCSRHSERSEKS